MNQGRSQRFFSTIRVQVSRRDTIYGLSAMLSPSLHDLVTMPVVISGNHRRLFFSIVPSSGSCTNRIHFLPIALVCFLFGFVLECFLQAERWPMVSLAIPAHNRLVLGLELPPGYSGLGVWHCSIGLYKIPIWNNPFSDFRLSSPPHPRPVLSAIVMLLPSVSSFIAVCLSATIAIAIPLPLPLEPQYSRITVLDEEESYVCQVLGTLTNVS